MGLVPIHLCLPPAPKHQDLMHRGETLNGMRPSFLDSFKGDCPTGCDFSEANQIIPFILPVQIKQSDCCYEEHTQFCFQTEQEVYGCEHTNNSLALFTPLY